MKKAESNLKEVVPYIPKELVEDYYKILMPAAEYHDVGKLSAENQKVLCGYICAKHLSVDHRDAGVKLLLDNDFERPEATLVYAHHRPGLPDLPEQKVSETPFRIRSAMLDSDVHLREYLEQHGQIVGKQRWNAMDHSNYRLSALEYRILLSCLVDADYSDTSGEDLVPASPRWEERFQKLNAYVNKLTDQHAHSNPERNELRHALYQSCCAASTEYKLEYCDSPVGTGKTTAILAHMLKVAREHKLRHILIVLPYTNIISQVVEVLREAVILDGEDPLEIVAENHHQADFERIEYRQLSATWTAPIVVTTAVQFFETLAGNQPARLRKLHQLPGSCIIFDEYHAALPVRLMPSAWKWITTLTEQWGCRICMCSATSFEFWNETVFQNQSTQPIMPLLPTDVSERLNAFERNRVSLDACGGEILHFEGKNALAGHLKSYHGSKIVVLNTVQSAAVFAKCLRDSKCDVLHLSSALTPEDRERTLSEIKKRLEQQPNRDWILVATSCVECGMDFSFHYGFCELRSLTSYLQLSGRIRRNAEFAYGDAFLKVFTIVDAALSDNPMFQDSKKVFKDLVGNGSLQKLSITQAVTKAFRNESKLNGQLSEKICKDERRLLFETVAKEFRVVEENTVTVIASQELVDRLRSNASVSYGELQRGSVRIRQSVCKRLMLLDEELPILDGSQL